MKRTLLVVLLAVGLLTLTVGPAVAADGISAQACTLSISDDSFSTQKCTQSLDVGTLGCTSDGDDDDDGGTC